MDTTKYLDKNNNIILESRCIKCTNCKCENEYFMQELRSTVVECKSCKSLINFPTDNK